MLAIESYEPYKEAIEAQGIFMNLIKLNAKIRQTFQP